MSTISCRIFQSTFLESVVQMISHYYCSMSWTIRIPIIIKKYCTSNRNSTDFLLDISYSHYLFIWCFNPMCLCYASNENCIYWRHNYCYYNYINISMEIHELPLNPISNSTVMQNDFDHELDNVVYRIKLVSLNILTTVAVHSHQSLSRHLRLSWGTFITEIIFSADFASATALFILVPLFWWRCTILWIEIPVIWLKKPFANDKIYLETTNAIIWMQN